MDYSTVKKAIEDAFSAVEYPGDDVVVFKGVEDPEQIEALDRPRLNLLRLLCSPA